MKTAISKSTLLAFSLMLLIFPGLVSCKKDKNDIEPPLGEQLAGEWEMRSFTVEGVEMMDFVLSSSILEFEASAGTGGDYEWLFAYTDGTSTLTNGEYEVDEDSEELIFDSNSGYEARYDIYINGDNLELSGIVDGAQYELKLKRD